MWAAFYALGERRTHRDESAATRGAHLRVGVRVTAHTRIVARGDRCRLSGAGRSRLRPDARFGNETRIATHTSKSVPAVAPTGCAVLLVEQRALEALRISDYGYILVGGAVEVEAPAAQLLERQDIGEIFLGRAYPQPAGA